LNLSPDVKACIDRNAELFKPIAPDAGALIGPNDTSPARERVPLTCVLKQPIGDNFRLTLKMAGKAARRGEDFSHRRVVGCHGEKRGAEASQMDCRGRHSLPRREKHAFAAVG